MRKEYQSDLNPLQIPDLIWEHVHPYLEKYEVSLAAQAPDEIPERPFVTWKILKRTKGDSGVLKNPRLFGQSNNPDNTTTQHYTQLFTLIVQYTLHSPHSAQLTNMAWDFENAILGSQAAICPVYPHFKIEFLEQNEDSLAYGKKPLYETIDLKFKIVVPVTYNKIYRTLRNIHWVYWSNELVSLDDSLTRTSSSMEFEFPLLSNQQIERVYYVKRFINNEWQDLEPGIDYKVKKTGSTRTVIEWLEFGSVPAVGETFLATYSVKRVVTRLKT